MFIRAWLVRLLVGVIILALPACNIPVLRHAEPAANLPDDYAAASNSDAISATTANDPTGAGNSALRGVDEYYNDPTLSNLIAQVVNGNRELKILNEEVEVATNEVLTRTGAYLPMVTFGAEAGLDKPGRFTRGGAVEEQLEIRPGRRFPDPLANYTFGFNLFMPLDIWREYRNARDAAIQRYFATIEARNDFATRLIAEVAETYYNLLAFDKRIENLDQIIALQEQSLELAESRRDAGRDTELPVQRFLAEVRKNESEKLVVTQEIVQAENQINALAYRLPQTVERNLDVFDNPTIQMVDAGIPTQLLLNRPDIRKAERELIAAGLDIQVARARFFPRLDIVAGVGWEAFNPRYLFFTPESLAYNLVGSLLVPVINRAAIKADYLTANARQLQAVYEYQQVILKAYSDVVNQVARAENLRKSIILKEQQLESLESSVDVASKLFQNARVEYVEVLLAQRDLLEARMAIIETRKERFAALVNVYRSLGGGLTYFRMDEMLAPTTTLESVTPVEEPLP
jgi:NodT family efflux transporter outer membrane factor (OMF) lipoprotein